MLPHKLITKLIDLQDRADAHTFEYHKLQNLPGHKSKASAHLRKAVRLRAKIRLLIQDIASHETEANQGAAEQNTSV